MTPLLLEARHVTKIFPTRDGGLTALLDVSVSARRGEFISIIGPSGCGKSTLLRLLAGLIPPSSGEIIEYEKKRRGDHGIVFQQYSLFPWLTVERNIEFGLRLNGMRAASRRHLISHYIGVSGLRGFERAYPKELSGGMQQRAALARALAVHPRCLFLDEPFAALDTQTRRVMQDLLLQVWTHEPRTVILVTHDVPEAVFMSDTVYVLSASPGRVRDLVVVPLPRPRTRELETSRQYINMVKCVQNSVTQSLKLKNAKF